MAEWQSSNGDATVQAPNDEDAMKPKFDSLHLHSAKGKLNGTSSSYQKKLQLPQSRWETFMRIRHNRQNRLASKLNLDYCLVGTGYNLSSSFVSEQLSCD